MTKGPTTGRKSLLLDYISAFQPISLFTAVRNPDYLVALSVLGSLLLKLLIISSTGLFLLSPVLLTNQHVPVELPTSFKDSLSNGFINDTIPMETLIGITTWNETSFPIGTDSESAFQIFSSTGLPPNSRTQATVDGLFSSLDCEPAILQASELYIQRSYRNQTAYFTKPTLAGENQILHYLSDSCTVSNVAINNTAYILNTIDVMDNSNFSWIIFRRGICDEDVPEKRRIVISSGTLFTGTDQHFTGSSSDYANGTMTNASVIESAQFLCTPGYQIQKVVVEFNGTDAEAQYILNKALPTYFANSSLPDVLPWDIAETQFLLLEDGVDDANDGNIFPDFSALDNSNQSFYIDPAMYIGVLLQTMQNNSKIALQRAIQESSLETIAVSYYRAISALVAHRSLMNSNTTILGNGTAAIWENRIIVGVLSVRIIESGLVLLILASVALIFLISRRPKRMFHPGNLMGIAAVLQNSPDLRAHLNGTGSASLESLETHLGDQLFHSGTDSSHPFTIKMDFKRSDRKETRLPNHLPIENRIEFWNPFPLKIAGRVVTFVALIALIVVLEIVLRISERNNGLADVSGTGFWRYLWVYIPALTMVGVAALFSSQDFAVRTLAVYCQIKKGASFQHMTKLIFQGRTSLATIRHSLWTRQWAVSAATLAAFIGSFLTIVVSGLFSPVVVPFTQRVQVKRSSIIYTGNPQNLPQQYTYAQGIFTGSLIIHGNISEPRWTHEDLVFPSISMAHASDLARGPDFGTPGSLTLNLTATRSRLTCRLSAPSNLNVTLIWGPTDISAPPPANVNGWSHWGPMTNPLVVTAADEECKSLHQDSSNGPEPSTPQRLEVYPNTYFGLSASLSDMASPLCSNWTYMWGRIGPSSVEHLAFFACNATLEDVNVETTLTLPDFQFDESQPLIPDESTARPSQVEVPFTEYAALSKVYGDENFDDFFQAMVYGKNGTPATDFASADNDITVSGRIKTVQSLLMTQVLNNWTRMDTNSSTVGRALPAQLNFPNRLRLVQDPMSTRVLEALLGAMLLLAALNTVLMKTRGVVPKNPCSIAAAASLLADSNILDALPRGAERMSSEEIERRAGFKGKTFYMGWYEKDETAEKQRQTVRGKSFAIYMVDAEQSEGQRLLPSRIENRGGKSDRVEDSHSN
jgi:hypothetical protein